MAEALLRSISHGRIEVASAGSDPQGAVNPRAFEVMETTYKLDLAGSTPSTGIYSSVSVSTM
jgi:protein-tyrosine-phosphatase